jgi:hypothetical protein
MRAFGSIREIRLETSSVQPVWTSGSCRVRSIRVAAVMEAYSPVEFRLSFSRAA